MLRATRQAACDPVVAHDVRGVRPQCADKAPHRGDATAQRRGHPVPEELVGGGRIAVIPEMLELVLEYPGAMNAPIRVPQAIAEPGIARGPMPRVPAEQPPQPLSMPLNRGNEARVYG